MGNLQKFKRKKTTFLTLTLETPSIKAKSTRLLIKHVAVLTIQVHALCTQFIMA